MLRSSQITPLALGLKDVDLTSAPGQFPTSPPILDFRRAFLIDIFFSVTNGGAGGVGTAKILVQRVDDDDNDIGDALDLITGIDISDAVEAQVSIGPETPIAYNGTIGTNADSWRVLDRAKIILEITASSDATTPVGSVTVQYKYAS